MIVSHRHRFIFIKTHKTAGSSIEMALAPLCGPDDIVTPMESNRDSGLPRNFHADTWLGRNYARSKWLRKIIARDSKALGPWFWEHMPASRVRQLIGEETWNSYHKFCIERNPWSKVVSYYNWKKFGQERGMPSFREYVLTKTHRLPMDARLYFDGDTCLMDEVIQYDDFRTGFTSVCKRLGIPFDGRFPREKTGMTSRPVDYRMFYENDTIAMVAEKFAREISHFGYVFDEEVT